MKIVFPDKAWEDYLYWQNTGKSTLKKINSLIKEDERLPCEGNGKPKPLKHNLTGLWSLRINLEHRWFIKSKMSPLFFFNAGTIIENV